MNRFNDEIKVEVESDKSAGGGDLESFYTPCRLFHKMNI